MYQGFSLLTANVPTLRDPTVTAIAQRVGVDTRRVVFRFAMQVGIVPLTGTTDEGHMKSDLETLSFDLTPEELMRVEQIGSATVL